MLTATLVESPLAVPHDPPILVMFALVDNGNETVNPLSFVTVTIGGVLSMVMDFGPDVPPFPTVSACVAVNV